MNYSKALAAVLASGLSAAIVALTGDNAFSNVELINVAIAVVSAGAVFAAPNVPHARISKAIMAVLMAVLTLLVNLIADGVTVSEWLQLAVAALSAVGVYAVRNTPDRTVDAA